jgi:Tetratricopeptide repeat
VGGLASGRALAADKKPTPEPFYRKYLVAGDPLDDRIVEQEKRVEASPDDANLRNDFGNLLAERKFPAQAAEQYEIALKLDKKNFISAYNLGLLRETEGKISDAISAYKRSIKRKPGFPQSRFRLGRLYEHTNQPQPAVHEYAEAFWIDPAMRDAKRNPLIIDCQLIYLASMANYERDIAVASMTDSKQYFDTDRFRKLPTTRVISSKEAEPSADEENVGPRDVGAPNAPGVTGASGPSEPARRGGTRGVPAGGIAPGAPPPASAPGSRPAPGMRRTPLPHPQAAPPQQATPPPASVPENVEPPPEAPPQEPAPEQTPPPDVEPS